VLSHNCHHPPPHSIPFIIMSLSRALGATSRLAVPALVRPAATSVNASRFAKVGLCQRAFTQSRPSLQDAAKTPAATPAAASSTPAVAAPAPSSFSEIVERYGGWYPFLGLAGVIAISKEFLILNEELLLASNFAFVVGSLYFTMGDTVMKAAEDQAAEIHKKMDEISDLQIDALQTAVQAHELNIEQVAVLKSLKQQYNQLATDLNKARALKVRHAARDAMMKRLTDIRSREASERASFRQVVGEKATAYVRREFASAPAATKASLIDFAIEVVEGKKDRIEPKADPIRKMYVEYFEKKLYEQEIAEEKRQKAAM